MKPINKTILKKGFEGVDGCHHLFEVTENKEGGYAVGHIRKCGSTNTKTLKRFRSLDEVNKEIRRALNVIRMNEKKEQPELKEQTNYTIS